MFENIPFTLTYVEKKSKIKSIAYFARTTGFENEKTYGPIYTVRFLLHATTAYDRPTT